MKVQRAYCSAVDHEVPLRFAPAEPSHPGAPRWKPVGCLDYGVRCTGAMCPFFALPELGPEDLTARSSRPRRRPAPGPADRGSARGP